MAIAFRLYRISFVVSWSCRCSSNVVLAGGCYFEEAINSTVPMVTRKWLSHSSKCLWFFIYQRTKIGLWLIIRQNNSDRPSSTRCRILTMSSYPGRGPFLISSRSFDSTFWQWHSLWAACLFPPKVQCCFNVGDSTGSSTKALLGVVVASPFPLQLLLSRALSSLNKNKLEVAHTF